ncbi:MAG: FG-GAP repeat protein [Blastocatellales bacterium]
MIEPPTHETDQENGRGRRRTAAGDQFGHSVAISGATIVVGAPFTRIGGNGSQGSAYVYDP